MSHGETEREREEKKDCYRYSQGMRKWGDKEWRKGLSKTSVTPSLSLIHLSGSSLCAFPPKTKSPHGSKVQYYMCTLNRAVGTQTQTYGLRVREREKDVWFQAATEATMVSGSQAIYPTVFCVVYIY